MYVPENRINTEGGFVFAGNCDARLPLDRLLRIEWNVSHDDILDLCKLHYCVDKGLRGPRSEPRTNGLEVTLVDKVPLII